jgi:uncharacterized protein (DUF1778 family)
MSAMSPNRKRAKLIATKLTDHELRIIKRAADLSGLLLTGYMRTRCLTAARQELSAVRPDLVPKQSRTSALAREALANAG